jgi:hypothetical protein
VSIAGATSDPSEQGKSAAYAAHTVYDQDISSSCIVLTKLNTAGVVWTDTLDLSQTPDRRSGR